MQKIFLLADPNNHLSINAHFIRFSFLMGFIVIGVPIGVAMMFGYVRRAMFGSQSNINSNMEKSKSREKYINKILVKVCGILEKEQMVYV